MRRIAFAFAVILFSSIGCAFAVESVDVALVLVNDVSRSIDEGEYQLQKEGYVKAFTDPQVIRAIKGGPVGAIAVAYVEFADSAQVRTVLEWQVLRDEGSVRDFAEKVRAAPRSFWGRTAIGAGIEQGIKELARLPFDAQRQVIDVCGDGTNNAGRDVTQARDEAVRLGITVNALAILSTGPDTTPWFNNAEHVNPPGGLTNYFRQNVAGGEGSFVLEVRDFHTFGDAMKQKLINEIADAGPIRHFAEVESGKGG